MWQSLSTQNNENTLIIQNDQNDEYTQIIQNVQNEQYTQNRTESLIRQLQNKDFKDICDFSTDRGCAFFLGSDLQQYTTSQQRPAILQIKSENEVHAGGIKSQRNLIYFHGDEEDLGSCYSFLLQISNTLECDVYALEYPQQGIYDWNNRNKSKAVQIQEDAKKLYEYVSKEPNFNPKELIILGRSMGAGLASWLARRATKFSNWNGYLVLISPFQSIQIAKSQTISLNQSYYYFFEDFFDNQANLTDFPQPTLFIHGQRDSIINFTQSKQLSKIVKQPSEHYPEYMDHDYFNFQQEIAEEINQFLYYIFEKRQCFYQSFNSQSIPIENPTQINQYQQNSFREILI